MMSTKLYLYFYLVLVGELTFSSEIMPMESNILISDPRLVSKEWELLEKATRKNYSIMFQNENNEFEALRKEIENVWKDKMFSDKKVYVHYSEDKHSRVIVDYEHGEITAESLDTQPQKPIKEIIMDVIGAKQSSNDIAPILYSEDLNITKKSIIENEIEKKSTGLKVVINKVKKSQVVIKMSPDWRRRREELYIPIVTKWSNEYKVEPSFVMAVIRAESSFNPNAISTVGAIGLMQIMPQYAGREVANRLGHSEQSSPNYLYDPNVNIQYGVYYLKILRDEYFSSVKSDQSKRHLTIAGYNWGPENLKRALARRNIKIESPPTVIEYFLMSYSPNETQEYLRRVIKFYSEYSGFLINSHKNKEVCLESR